MNWIAILCAVFLLAGCATQLDGAAGRLATARNYVQAKNYDEAIDAIRPDIWSSDKSGEQAREFFLSDKALVGRFPDFLRGQIKDSPNVYRLSAHIDLLKRDIATSLLGDDNRKILSEYANSVALENNKSGKFDVNLKTDINNFPQLKLPDAQDIIFRRSVDYLKTKPRNRQQSVSVGLADAVFLYAEKAGLASPEYVMLKRELANLSLSATELKGVPSRMFPTWAAQTIEGRAVTVRLMVSDDRLLELDLLERLKGISPNLTLISDPTATVTVTIAKLQWEERVVPERTQTITYSQGDVNMLAAALLMPRNASYLYEMTSGGLQVSYAYEVKANSKNMPPFDEVIREKVAREWRSCSNARVQNVFGGVQRADFVANPHMQNTCNGGTPISIDTVRNEALGAIIQAIKSVPPIAGAIVAD